MNAQVHLKKYDAHYSFHIKNFFRVIHEVRRTVQQVLLLSSFAITTNLYHVKHSKNHSFYLVFEQGSLLATYVQMLCTHLYCLCSDLSWKHKLLTTMCIMVLVCNFRMHLNKENWTKIWSFCIRMKYSEDLCILCKFVAN